MITAQHNFIKGNSYGVKSYWFTFLIECNGFFFIINKKNGFILREVDRTKVKFIA